MASQASLGKDRAAQFPKHATIVCACRPELELITVFHMQRFYGSGGEWIWKQFLGELEPGTVSFRYGPIGFKELAQEPNPGLLDSGLGG